MKTFPGIAILLAMLLPAIAQARGQQVNIFSFDDASCSAWSKTAGNKLVRAQYEFWIRGFVSGHNYANPAQQIKVGGLPGSNGLYQFLDQYCRENPSSSFVSGAIMLVEQLRERVAPVRPAPGKKEPAKAAPAPAARN